MITITSVVNPVYVNVEETAINCTITTKELGVLPFTATSNDPEPHGRKLWVALLSGVYGTISPYGG